MDRDLWITSMWTETFGPPLWIQRGLVQFGVPPVLRINATRKSVWALYVQTRGTYKAPLGKIFYLPSWREEAVIGAGGRSRPLDWVSAERMRRRCRLLDPAKIWSVTLPVQQKPLTVRSIKTALLGQTRETIRQKPDKGNEAEETCIRLKEITWWKVIFVSWSPSGYCFTTSTDGSAWTFQWAWLGLFLVQLSLGTKALELCRRGLTAVSLGDPPV